MPISNADKAAVLEARARDRYEVAAMSPCRKARANARRWLRWNGFDTTTR